MKSAIDTAIDEAMETEIFASPAHEIDAAGDEWYDKHSSDDLVVGLVVGR